MKDINDISVGDKLFTAQIIVLGEGTRVSDGEPIEIGINKYEHVTVVEIYHADGKDYPEDAVKVEYNGAHIVLELDSFFD